jgi:hypothetical protein
VADNRPGASLLKQIDVRLIVRLLDNEDSLKNVIYALSVIYYYNPHLASSIVDNLDKAHLVDLYVRCQDEDLLTYSLLLLGRIEGDVFRFIVQHLGKEILNLVIDSEWPTPDEVLQILMMARKSVS